MTLHIAPIVEGETEELCFEPLLQHIWNKLPTPTMEALRVAKPTRCNRSAIAKPSHRELEEKMQYALDKLLPRLREPGVDRGLVLVLIDADEDCPARLAPQLLSRAKKVRSDVDVDCVVAKRKLENWFTASAESLSGAEGLPLNLRAPYDPESRGGDAWLTQQMKKIDRRRKYVKPTHAVTFVRLLDVALCRGRSPSFDKLCRVLEARRVGEGESGE